ncbi:uncharacterized protein LOC121366667, partial [Gigantopelta aegis]|uniref:uncharacterized protein LOC121366667 n=1 Tax=Gigantopelta aegis TaxID=1735272 RepID=UPI001B888C5F
MTQKGYICNCSNSELYNTCVHHTMDRSWFSANSSCTLKTLNENNVEYIRTKINGGVSYWIGLKRSKYIVWIDRDELVNTEISYNISGCLMMQKRQSGDISFHISNCSEQKAALCLTYSSFSAPIPITEHPTDQSGSTYPTSSPLDKDKHNQS